MKWFEIEDKFNSKVGGYFEKKWKAIATFFINLFMNAQTRFFNSSPVKGIQRIPTILSDIQIFFIELPANFKKVNFKAIMEDLKESPFNLKRAIDRIHFNPIDRKVLTTTFYFFCLCMVSYWSYKIVYLSAFRKPATAKVEEKINYRQSYYNKEKKQLLLSNLLIPVTLNDGNKRVHTVSAEINVQLTSKFAKIYLEKNMHLIAHELNTGVFAVVKEFPLTKEGKMIIKSKILERINEVLVKSEIPGEAENLAFLDIISS